jgi:D-beta-D-heptose 7-phosphate kinase/D-beta-D-heptose 1-phosphate adenosyltransferase
MDGELLASIDRLRTARVLCIGDVMLDHYVYGQSDRLSPEAPVPVLTIDSETRNRGGAGNVLRNLAALSFPRHAFIIRSDFQHLIACILKVE